MPSASSKNVFTGCSIEIELVMAARKRRKNQANPIQRPISAHLMENDRQSLEAKPEGAVPTIPLAPRKTNAAVIVIKPPKPTSKSSFVALAVKPDNAMSSFFFRYEA